MFEKLYPKKYLSSVFELNPKELKEKGIKAIFFDIDNTLVPYWIKTPDDKLKDFFKDLSDAGFTLAVLSNSREERSRTFCSEIPGMTYVFRAKKPLTKGFLELSGKVGIEPAQTAIIGDQIFTDVLCGNLVGAYSILVKQVSPKDELITAPKRPFEKIVLREYFKWEGQK